MILADYLFIGISVACGILGLHFGFDKMLNGVTKGIKGIIFSIFVCVLLFSYLQSFAPIGSLLGYFRNLLFRSDNAFVRFLVIIRIEMIIFAIFLFAVIRLVEMILSKIISHAANSENSVIKTLNRCLGLAFSFAFFLIGILVIGEIAYKVSSSDGVVYESLAGSYFGLDHLYLNNPIEKIMVSFFK